MKNFKTFEAFVNEKLVSESVASDAKKVRKFFKDAVGKEVKLTTTKEDQEPEVITTFGRSAFHLNVIGWLKISVNFFIDQMEQGQFEVLEVKPGEILSWNDNDEGGTVTIEIL